MPCPCPVPRVGWGCSCLSVHLVGCSGCPGGCTPAPGGAGVFCLGFVLCLPPPLLFLSFLKLCLSPYHYLMHLISFLCHAPAPKVCAELVSSLTCFGCLAHLEMGNLICSDGPSPSDFPPWVELLLPLDSAVLPAGAEWGLHDVPIPVS